MERLIQFFTKHTVTATMVTAAILLLGVLAYFRLDTTLLPDITYPQLTIVTKFADESPKGIEKRVTKPVEDALAGIRGLKETSSVSSQGLSIVKLTFDWTVNPDLAAMEVREKLDLIRNSLPQDAARPVVLKFNPNTAPLLLIVATSKINSDSDFRYFIKKNIQPFLRRIQGVGGIKVTGGDLPEIKVNINPNSLFAVQLTVQDIVQMIARANFNTPAGPLPMGDKEVMVRTIGEFIKAGDIAELLISTGDSGSSFRLKNIATVKTGLKERVSGSFYNTKDCVALAVYADASSGKVKTAREVRKTLKLLNKKFSKRANLTVLLDRSIYIVEAVQSVASAAIIGGILAFLVIMYFLRSIKESIILFFTIPVCISATLFLMFVNHITINIISLGGLALGIGMTVDSGIVVLESVRSKLEKGVPAEKAILTGSAQVAAPVFSSILTSIAVFLPIIFISGFSGKLFSQLAMTVTFALGTSFFTALSFIPAAMTIFKIKKNKEKTSFFGEHFFQQFMNKRKTAVLMAIILIIVAIPLFLLLRKQFLPAGVRPSINIHISFPSDFNYFTKKNTTLKLVHELTSKYDKLSCFTEIGVDPTDPTAAAAGKNRSEAFIVLSCEKYDVVKILPDIQKMTAQVIQFPHTVSLDTTLIEGIQSDNQHEITFDILNKKETDYNKIKKLIATIKRWPEFTKISTPSLERRNELQVIVDRKLAASLGVPVKDIAAALKLAISGDIATQFKTGDRHIDIRIRYSKKYRKSILDLERIYFRVGQNAIIPLNRLASVKKGTTESRIFHKNTIKSVEIKCSLKKNVDNDHILRKLKKAVQRNNLTFISKQSVQTTENLNELLFAFILAIVLVYMILAGQFGQYVTPLIVMSALPLSFTGSFVLLHIFGSTMNIISAMGLIMLAGTAVNNTIVLYEAFKNQIELGKNSYKSAGIAIQLRTRPILMTSATTVFGLVPLMFNTGSMQKDMAIAVVGGLFTSTILVLVIFPQLLAWYSTKRKV